MIEINNKKLCESCFSAVNGEEVCPCCGFNGAEYSPDPMVLPIGTRLDSKVIIGRVMGKGGFGITYLGYDPRVDKTIAVKEYYPNGISYRTPGTTEVSIADTKSTETFESGAEKFYTEAEMVSQFNGNPNIVSVYDYFRANGTVYLIMEYINGVTLKTYVDRHGKLNDGQALYVMDKIVAALSITHSAGVLHRDISPDNIMICADGKVKLIDFGAARQILAESSSNLTVVMKPGYTPIEQYTKKGKQGAWTDIYSLGVSMYYALTRIIIDDPYARMDDDEEFEENKFNINEQLWEILKKCTMINASDRYGSAIELRKALKSVSAPLTPEMITLSTEDLKHEPENPEPDNDEQEEILQTTAAPAAASSSSDGGDDFPVTVASGDAEDSSDSSGGDDFPVTVASGVAADSSDSSGGNDGFPVTAASDALKSEAPKKIEGNAAYAPKKKKRAGFSKKGKLIAIVSAAAVVLAAAIVVLFVVQPFSSAKMRMNGRNIPVKASMFDIQSGNDALTVHFCGKTGSSAYVCTVIFKETPKENTDYSADKAIATISYSGKDTREFNDVHQFATLSTELSTISVGKYDPDGTIEITVSGTTIPDIFGDFDGELDFTVSGKAKFKSGSTDALADWKKVNIING